MTETILFIHGTGVRSHAFAKTLQLITAKVAKFLPHYRVAGCDWGDAFGARLNAKGASIPGYGDVSGASVSAIESAETARWTLLNDDPLLELRISSFKMPLGNPGGPLVWSRLKDLSTAVEPLELLAEWHLDSIWPDFIIEIAGDLAWHRTVTGTIGSEAELGVLLARAVTAALLRYLQQHSESGLIGSQRDRLVSKLVEPLGGTGLGIGDWFLGKLTTCAMPLRSAVSDKTGPPIGDILRYQARGETLLKFISERVRQTNASIIFAHSLGGVAAVDWLSMEDRSLRALVTAGSQSPYFYEIDALRSRSYGEGLPEFFPSKWINFLDRRDFLSYPAQPIFDRCGVDVIVDNGQPFPASHTAYWQNDAEVWPEIARFLS